jgi:proline iminopeptidase
MADNTSGSLEFGGSRVAWFREHRGPGPVICAAHPVEEFGQSTAALLADMTGCSVVCVSTNDPQLSLEEMVVRVEEVRHELGYDRWYYWGMSGGGWLSQLYARRYPESLLGIVIESVCACFRVRLADPECVISPHYPVWREALSAKGMFDPAAHAKPSSGDGTEWVEIEGVGQVFRRVGGAALLVSPIAIGERMRVVMPRLWTFDAREWLPDLHVPTLVMCGTADPVVPIEHARRVSQSIPAAKFVAIEGGGHVPTVERSVAVTNAWRSFRG